MMIYEPYERRYEKLQQNYANGGCNKQVLDTALANNELAFRNNLWTEYVEDGFSRAKAQDIESQLWNLAWEYGHSSGYAGVEQHYIDFADLVNSVS